MSFLTVGEYRALLTRQMTVAQLLFPSVDGLLRLSAGPPPLEIKMAAICLSCIDRCRCAIKVFDFAGKSIRFFCMHREYFLSSLVV